VLSRPALFAVFLAVLAWSAAAPHDYPTWALETAPAVIGAGILVATRRSFPLTDLACVLALLHAIVLCVGGHYTYAMVPLFDRLRAWTGGRNDYDRLGHLFQGFVPAILAREVLLRRSPLRPGKWLFFLVLCVCMAISAFYELIEWRVAVFAGAGADAFLGTQGDPWDTQWDMACALIGALAAQLSLSRLHDRQLRALPSS